MHASQKYTIDSVRWYLLKLQEHVYINFSAGPSCFSMLLHPYRSWGALLRVYPWPALPYWPLWAPCNCFYASVKSCWFFSPIPQIETCSLMVTLSGCSYLTITYYQFFPLFHHYLCWLLWDWHLPLTSQANKSHSCSIVLQNLSVIGA